jgi:uncharacterized membrane protein
MAIDESIDTFERAFPRRTKHGKRGGARLQASGPGLGGGEAARATKQEGWLKRRFLPLTAGGALLFAGLRNRSPAGLAMLVGGSSLVMRGLFARKGPEAERTILASFTIARAPEELYDFFRQLENLPRFMRHLVSVEQTSATRSSWIAKGPLKSTVSWEAEITDDQRGERLAWRSIPGSTIENSGEVRFERAAGDRGTVVSVLLRYTPPAGKLGVAVAKLFGEEPAQQLRDDLRRLKQMMEAHELPTIEGQPMGH